MDLAPRAAAAVLALALAAGAPLPAGAAPPSPARTMAPAAARAARPQLLAVLVGRPGEPSTALHLVDPARASGRSLPLGPAVATVAHPPLATIRAAVQGDGVVAVIDQATRGDRSFASSLVRVHPGAAPTSLIAGVVHASRPTPRPGSTEVLVSRGAAAVDPATGARDDRLSIDAIDVATGAARTVMTDRGSLLFVAGVAGAEAIVYRVDARGKAALVAVDLASGRRRALVADLPPFARDFSIDGAAGRLVFQNRHRSDAARWVVESVALDTGVASVLHEDASMQLAPHLWPDGSLALTRDPKRPLERLDLGAGVKMATARDLPEGVARVAAIDGPGSQVAVASTVGGGLPSISLVQTSSGASLRLSVPAGDRATIAGFVPVPGGAR
jgi:hypothetical protein